MSHRINRRTLIAGIAAVGIAGLEGNRTAADDNSQETIEKSLERLRDGNARFVDGTTLHAHQGANWRKQLVEGQQPFATILGCSDSRVPTELVFDQGFGDLFVVRVAGNVIAPDVVGSLEYAAAHLRTPLIVILGHEGCGAVTAALKAMKAPANELPGVASLIKLIEPGLPKTQAAGSFESELSAAVEANVRWSLAQVAGLPEARRPIAEKKIRIVGAVYDLKTGRVRFLDER